MLLFCTVTDFTVHNVSTFKPSVQVSTYSDQHPASNANDGSEQTCAASEPETNPWWAVNLEGPTLVFMVKLTNSGDAKGILVLKFTLVTFFLLCQGHVHIFCFNRLKRKAYLFLLFSLSSLFLLDASYFWGPYLCMKPSDNISLACKSFLENESCCKC